jgi:catechol 2,3-dioxygenase-like lactoylglutathione lyase family enzyme
LSVGTGIIGGMVGRLYSVILDCPDPRSLAAFYARLLGLRQRHADDDWVAMEDPRTGWRVNFQRAEDFQPPRWPDPAHPQQIHLDVMVDDIDAAEAEALAIGATRLPGQGDDFRVFTDPVGHPFCLIWTT